MPTIGELLNDLAIKAGVPSDNEDLKKLLSSPELATIKAPDELVQSIDRGLLSIDAAKNNHPDIKKKYFADAYDGMDKQLMALIANDTFDQADVDEIARERSTVKKQELIVSKLKASRANASNQKDKDAINDQLKQLHEQIRLKNEEVANVRKEADERIKNFRLKAELSKQLAGYKTIYDELPSDVKETTLEALINKALQDKSARLDVDDNGKITLIGQDGSNVFGGNHVQLTPQSFLDQTFAPILKKSGTPTQPASPSNPTPPNNSVDYGIKSHTEQVLADISKSRTSLV